MAKKKTQKYYVVWSGHETGIFDNWPACQTQIKGYPNAIYKSFKSKALAEEAYYGDSRNYIGKATKNDTALSAEELALIGSPIAESLAVDAACSGNPGILEYQGVDTKTGIRLFYQGKFPLGTTNLGEFLALVHGIAYLKQKNSDLPIYSDSKIAIGWVKKKYVRTTLARTPKTAHLFSLVDRAVKWLQNNDYNNKILKWETKAWGEIPADFGRK